MNTSKRPMSPNMLGPYYKFQITSALSILNRLTGVFMSVVTSPFNAGMAILLAGAMFYHTQLGLQVVIGSLAGTRR
jgi:succinate dehydrogenase / fumarate reductase cytochrome b subunit